MTKYTLHTDFKGPSRSWDPARDLDAEQQAVVMAPACPLLVVAGAGTGKTRALTYRAARLIQLEGGSDGIMLCTFTNRAAKEMLRRVEDLTGMPASGMWAGTFHHVANRLLRTYGERAGMPESYSIVDKDDAQQIITQLMPSLKSKLDRRRYPQPEVLLAIFSHSVNTLQPIEDVIRSRWPAFEELTEEVTELAGLYSRRKARLNLLDFDDLLMGWRLLMSEESGCSDEIRERFRHVLVDEYQDVNLLQAELVDMVAREGHKSLTVVGDDAQSIYSFRGADIKIMLEFGKRYPDAVLLRLCTNYRSVPPILVLANRSIACNLNRLEKTLCPARKAGPLPVSAVLPTVELQAAFVCQRVLELHHDSAIPLRRMAVLYRSHSCSLELQMELSRRSIPYSIRSGLRFFEQAHIKDALAYLKVLHNPRDELAMGRVVQMQSGLGRAFAEALNRFMAEADRSNTTLSTLIKEAAGKGVSSAKRKALEELAATFEVMDRILQTGGVREAIVDLVKGPLNSYARRRYANAEERLEDLAQLAEYSGRYRTVEEMLSDLALTAGVTAERGELREEPEKDRLNLSTVHQAKGLEWQVVFLIWLGDGRFPSALALRDSVGEEEERRLFHVAVTRAQDELYLVRPAVADSMRGLQRVVRPSRFLTELNDDPPFEVWQIDLKPMKDEGSDVEGGSKGPAVL